MPASDSLRRIALNPFFVLGLPPTATRAEVEREGQKLLGMLELGLKAAGTYASPAGPQPRSADLVREALAELRDPQRRLGHELWAQARPRAEPLLEEEKATAAPRFAHARARLGWRR